MNVFFLHNPKAGGSSVRAVLESLVPNEKTAPTFCNAPEDARARSWDVEALRGFGLYAGHYGYDVFEEFGTRHALITNFRNPVDRIRSLYRYWRNNVDLNGLSSLHEGDARVVRLAHSLSFSEFIRSSDPNLRLYLENFHFRQIFKSGWEWCDVNAVNISIVHNRISGMEWFYVAEMPQASIVLFKDFLGPECAAEIPYENVSSGPDVLLTDDDREYLLGINTLDLEIYALAVALQQNRLEARHTPGAD